jgi:hypothetical protein
MIAAVNAAVVLSIISYFVSNCKRKIENGCAQGRRKPPVHHSCTGGSDTLGKCWNDIPATTITGVS